MRFLLYRGWTFIFPVSAEKLRKRKHPTPSYEENIEKPHILKSYLSTKYLWTFLKEKIKKIGHGLYSF